MQVMFNDVFLSPAIDDKAPAVAPVTSMAGSSFPPAAIPPMVCDFSKWIYDYLVECAPK